MIMKKIGNILIIIGIVIGLFIVYAKVKTYFEQKRLINEYTSLVLTDDKTKNKQEQAPPKNGDAIGILQIPRINLKTPIVEGVTQDDIRYAVGHFPSSSSINALGEENQNFAIAGHRSYTYGKFFNRLNELENGDKIIIYTKNKIFTYKVYEKRIVLPTDVGVVFPIKGKSVVTLVTCHPMYSSKKRLIVYNQFVSEKKLDGSEIQK